jgi:hypothetical protein
MSSTLLALALLACYALPLARALRNAPVLRSDAPKVAIHTVPAARYSQAPHPTQAQK